MGQYIKNVAVTTGQFIKHVDAGLLGTGGTINSGPNNPTSGSAVGELFFNTTDDKLYAWNGSAWVDVT
jgi:hypothetical protein